MLPVSLYKKPDDDPFQNYGVSAKPNTLSVRSLLRKQAQREATLLPVAFTHNAPPLTFPAQSASVAITLQKMTWKPPELSSPSRSFLDAVRASEQKAADEATFFTKIGKTAELWAGAFPSTATLVDKAITLGPIFAALGAGCGGFAAIVVGGGLRSAAQLAATAAISFPSSVITLSVLDETCLKAQALKSAGEETVLYFLPQRDDNGVSHFLFAHKGVRELVTDGKKLVVERVDDPEQIRSIIANHGNISDIILSFHGNRDAISLDRESGARLQPFDAGRWPKNHFADHPQVIAHACAVAEGSYSFAELLQNILGDEFTVIAPTTDINAGDMRVQDGEVSFRKLWWGGEDVTAKFPRDNVKN